MSWRLCWIRVIRLTPAGERRGLGRVTAGQILCPLFECPRAIVRSSHNSLSLGSWDRGWGCSFRSFLNCFSESDVKAAEDSDIAQTWFKLCNVGQITSHFSLQLKIILLCRIFMRLNTINAYKVLSVYPAFSKYLINAFAIIFINKLSLITWPLSYL